MARISLSDFSRMIDEDLEEKRKPITVLDLIRADVKIQEMRVSNGSLSDTMFGWYLEGLHEMLERAYKDRM